MCVHRNLGLVARRWHEISRNSRRGRHFVGHNNSASEKFKLFCQPSELGLWKTKGGHVGKLISTGVVIGGHSSTIDYQDSDHGRTATLKCTCGWSVPLKSFDTSWGSMELQCQFDEHLPSHLQNVDPRSQEEQPTDRVISTG